VQGRTFTVARAQEGTSASSHSADAAVFHVLTAGALAQRDIEQFATGAIANRDAPGQAGRLYLPTDGFLSQEDGSAWNSLPFWRMTPPVIGDFTWVNQGTSTVTTRGGMMVLEPQGVASGENLRLLVKAAPATPYKITVAMLAQSCNYTAGDVEQFGVCWRESGSGKLICYGFNSGQYYSLYFRSQQWTNPTTISSSILSFRATRHHPLWLRFGDDGTNRLVEISNDGLSFEPVAAPQSRTTFITADQVGVFANSWNTSYGIPRVVSFLHWGQS
jgi:hypothetical protein